MDLELYGGGGGNCEVWGIFEGFSYTTLTSPTIYLRIISGVPLSFKKNTFYQTYNTTLTELTSPEHTLIN